MKIEMWDIAKIIPYEQNSKLHAKDQVAKIAESITRYGWDQPIVVDKGGVIIKGHGRRLAAIELKLEKVPVLVRSDLTPTQVRAARLADNRVALGNVDARMMQKEMAELIELGEKLMGVFEEKELQFMTEADLGAINDGVFVEDLNTEISAQAEANITVIDEMDAREVPIAKAFGFKTVQGSAERKISAFMAQVERQTDKKGADALVAFIDLLNPSF